MGKRKGGSYEYLLLYMSCALNYDASRFLDSICGNEAKPSQVAAKRPFLLLNEALIKSL